MSVASCPVFAINLRCGDAVCPSDIEWHVDGNGRIMMVTLLRCVGRANLQDTPGLINLELLWKMDFGPLGVSMCVGFWGWYVVLVLLG